MQSVTVTSPSGKSEYSENNKADGFFAFHSKETGAYRACFRANTQGVSSRVERAALAATPSLPSPFQK